MKLLFRLKYYLLVIALFTTNTAAQAIPQTTPTTITTEAAPEAVRAANQALEPMLYLPVVMAGRPQPAGMLVVDHETGNFTQYTDYQMSQNTVAVTSTAALAGSSYGMAVNLTGSTRSAYARRMLDQPWTTGVFRARFYLDPNGIRRIPGAGGNVFLFSTAAGQFLGGVSFGMNEAGTSHEIYAIIQYDNNNHRETEAVAISDAPHSIEVEWRRASGPGAANGSISLWVDGRFIDTQTGIDNDNIWTNVGAFALGANANVPSVSTGSYYLDELVCNPSGEPIGAAE